MQNAGPARLGVYTAGFNRVAAELGVEPVPSFAALLLGDLTLVTDVPELLGLPRAQVDGWTPRDPRRYRPGTRLRYTGPLFAHLDLPSLTTSGPSWRDSGLSSTSPSTQAPPTWCGRS